MSKIENSIIELLNSLKKLREVDLDDSLNHSDEDLFELHKLIKETQKTTSVFQQELSPFQKSINRKRVNILKRRGRISKEPTKAELFERIKQLESELDTNPKA